VLAEAATAPGPLHYLLEDEGFRILGAACDDGELTRLLTQSVKPEVIIVDAAVPAATAIVAHELAPESELIVIWPDSVVPPPSADQVSPELVYQDLGPAVTRAAYRNRLRRPVVEEPDEPIEPFRLVEEPDAALAGRSAARVLVGTIALIAAIVVTVGVSFALQGARTPKLATPSRSPVVLATSSAAPVGVGQTGSERGTQRPTGNETAGCAANRRGPSDHAKEHAASQASDCPAGGGANASGGGSAGGPGTNAGAGAGAGPGTQDGNGPGQSSGDHGSAGDHGNAGTNGPGSHPTGPPATPAPAGDHAGAKD
jgi:hypothetical protein